MKVIFIKRSSVGMFSILINKKDLLALKAASVQIRGFQHTAYVDKRLWSLYCHKKIIKKVKYSLEYMEKCFS